MGWVLLAGVVPGVPAVPVLAPPLPFAAADVVGGVDAAHATPVCDGQRISGHLGDVLFVRATIPPQTISQTPATMTFTHTGFGTHLGFLNTDTDGDSALRDIGHLQTGGDNVAWGVNGTDGPAENATSSPQDVVVRFRSSALYDFGPVFDWTATMRIKNSDGSPAYCPFFTDAVIDDLLGSAGSLAGSAADPVSTATGNMYDVSEDLAGPAGLSWSRAYNSLAGYGAADTSGMPRLLGPAMSTSLDMYLRPLDWPSDTSSDHTNKPGLHAGLEFRGPDGRKVVFAPKTGVETEWVVPANLHARATWNSSARQFTLAGNDGSTAVFTDTGRLVSTTNTAGEKVTACPASGAITNLRTGACGDSSPTFQLKLVDTGSDGLIDAVQLVDASNTVLSQVDYTFSGGRFASATKAHSPGTATGAVHYSYTNNLVTAIDQDFKAGTPVVTVPVVRSSYDSVGRVATQDLPNGDHVVFTYHASVDSSHTQTTDVTWCSGWTGTACGTGVTDTTETTKYTHSSDGRLVGLTDTNSHATGQQLDRDLLIMATDRAGAQNAAEYDLQGRLMSRATADPDSGFVPPRSGDADGCNRTAVSGMSYYAFPAPGSGGCVTTPNSSPPRFKGGFSVESYTYCTAETGLADPRVTSVTDATGAATKYLYKSTDVNNPCAGQPYTYQMTPTRIIDANNKITDIETARQGTDIDLGLTTKVTDADGVETTMVWDTTKRLKMAEGVGGNFTHFGYDAWGRLVVTRNPLGEETWNVYDGAGRLAETVGPVAVASRSCSNHVCTFPSIDVDGPTVRSEFFLDGTIAYSKQRATRSSTSGERVTEYDRAFKNVSSGAACTPPAAGCQLQESVTAPPHSYDPANPTATTRTVVTTLYNAAGKPYATRTSDTANVSSAVTATTTYQSDPANRATNLGLGRAYTNVSAGNITTGYGYDGNLTATGNGSVSGNGEVTSTGIGSTRVGVSTTVYDKRGRVVETRGPAVPDETGATVSSCAHTFYDTANRVIRTERGAGTSTLGSGCVASGSTHLSRTRYFFDAAGRATFTVADLNENNTFTDPTTCATVDTGDVVTQSTYSDAGRPKQSIEAPADAATFNWCTGTGKRVTERFYDSSGRVDHVVGPVSGAAATFYVYDTAGRVQETNLVVGTTNVGYTKTTFDAAGRTLTTTVPSPTGTGDATTVTCYNAFGDRTYQSDPHASVNLSAPCGSDGWGADKASFGGWQSFDYYDDGTVKYAWSALRKSLDSSLPASPTCTGTSPTSSACYAQTALFYDGRGNRTARRSWTANTTALSYHPIVEKWTYNADDQMTSATDPIQVTQGTPKSTEYTYYSDTDTTAGKLPGHLKSVKQPSGRTEDITYRADGKVTGQVFHDPNSGAQVDACLAFAYNAVGQRTKMSDVEANSCTPGAGGTVHATTFAYDAGGRLVSQTIPNLNDGTTSTNTWVYDLAGNVRERDYYDGARFRYDHDPDNAVNGVDVYVASAFVPLVAYTRDTSRRVTVETISGGTGAQSRGWTYANTKTGLPTRFVETVDGLTGGLTTDLTYRDDGRLNNETTAGVTTSYLYDDAGQLCAAMTGTASCTSGTVGNRYSYNARGMRMTQTAGTTTTSYTYDDNAEMLTATPSVGNATNYTWDLDGRRTTTETGTGTNSDHIKVITAYDPRGLIASTTTQTAGTQTGYVIRNYNADSLVIRTVEQYFGLDTTWDPTLGVPQILEGRANNSLSVRAAYGSERINIAIVGGSNPPPTYYAYDAHQSVIKTTVMTAPPTSYDPYGAPTGGTDAFTYRGEQTLTNLIYLRARDYDPKTGTFTTRDPLDGINGTTTVANPYHYTDNDPLNKTDPLGLRPSDTSDGISSRFEEMKATIWGYAREVCDSDPSRCVRSPSTPGPPAPPAPIPSPVLPAADPYAGPDHLYWCERSNDCRTGGMEKVYQFQAALLELFVDTYPSGFTIYWSRNATKWIFLNSGIITKTLEALDVAGFVSAFVLPPPFDVIVPAVILYLQLSWTFSVQDSVSAADQNSACLIFSSHWIGDPSTTGQWQSSSEVPDADKCRDSYKGG